MIRKTINLKEPAHYMGREGEILFNIVPNADGRGVTIEFDNELCQVKINGKIFIKPITSLEIQAISKS